MKSFGLITEGITDQEIISNIICGFFKNKDIPINELQPLRDATDRNRAKGYGGWGHVLEYCETEVFKQAFQSNNFIIIQIDTDKSEDYKVVQYENGRQLEYAELIIKVRNKIIEKIGEDFFNKTKDRILFAICVHSIECWLLPLFYDDTRAEKIVGCLKTLNLKLNSKHHFTIDPDNKKIEYYRFIAKSFLNNKTLKLHNRKNPSLEVFIQDLQERNIILEE